MTDAIEPVVEIELDAVIARVTDIFGDSVQIEPAIHEQITLVVDRDHAVGLLTFLRNDPALGFIHLSDLCGVDYLNQERQPRFAVVYHVLSPELNRRVRVRVPVDEDDPVVPSIVPLWSGANWFEREAFDLMGIRFAGHPNLTRILLPDEWEGHPLRKDYPEPFEAIEFSINPDEWQKAVRRG